MIDAQRLADWLDPTEARARYTGVAVGVVTNNQDPDGLGRVKVRFPWLSDADESPWARVVTPMAGKARGLYLLPEVDDEVLVAFEHGQADRPYVLGALWNGQDTPPESNSDGKNDRRSLTSRSGHVIRLDDTDGHESVVISDKTGENRITINTDDNSITLSAGGDVIVRSSRGKLTLSGAGIELHSTPAVSIKADRDASLEATGQVQVKGQMINLN